MLRHLSRSTLQPILKAQLLLSVLHELNLTASLFTRALFASQKLISEIAYYSSTFRGRQLSKSDSGPLLSLLSWVQARSQDLYPVRFYRNRRRFSRQAPREHGKSLSADKAAPKTRDLAYCSISKSRPSCNGIAPGGCLLFPAVVLARRGSLVSALIRAWPR